MVKSIFHLNKGTLINPLHLFYSTFGLVCKKSQQLVQYTPGNFFNSLVHSAVNAQFQGDEIANSSVVVETMKLLAHSSLGYQIMDRSWFTPTNFGTMEKRTVQKIVKCWSASTSILFNCTTLKSWSRELSPENQSFVVFFSLQNAEQTMSKLCYILSNKLWNWQAWRTWLEHWLLSTRLCRKRKVGRGYTSWKTRPVVRLRVGTDVSIDSASDNFFPRTCCNTHKKDKRREPSLF